MFQFYKQTNSYIVQNYIVKCLQNPKNTDVLTFDGHAELRVPAVLLFCSMQGGGPPLPTSQGNASLGSAQRDSNNRNL